jgi:hypothetical protein
MPVWAGSRAALVGVDADGQIIPANSAASISMLASNAAQAVAVVAAAEAAQDASEVLSNRLDAVEATIASQKQHLIFRGSVLSFSSAYAPATNMDYQIVQVDMRDVSTNTYFDLWTWFPIAPSNAPTVDYVTSTEASNNWRYMTLVTNSWPATTNIVIGTNVYQTYLTTLLVPHDQASAYYRVNGQVNSSSDLDNVLNVRNGIAVNGNAGATGYFTLGTNTLHFVGGVLVP